MNTAQSIGLRILERRHQKNLSQHELAKLVGRSQSSISLIEKGERELNMDSILRFCKALDLTPNGLFGVETEIGDAHLAEVGKAFAERPDLKEPVTTYVRYITGQNHIGMES